MSDRISGEHGVLISFKAVCFSCLLIALPVTAEADKPGNANPKYPAPLSVSEEARVYLSRPVMRPGTEGVPQTTQQWQQLRAASNSRYTSFVESSIASSGVKVVKRKIAGVTVREIIPKEIPAENKNRALIHVHGGGYVMLGGDLTVLGAMTAAPVGGYRVYSVDYRMPPEHPFPAAVHDAVAVYEALLEEYPAENLGFFGSSAGGGLAAAMTLAARDKGLPLPAAVALKTPWSDLSKTGDSYFANEGVDPVLPAYDGSLEAMAKIYAGDHDLKSPLLSPVYADYSKGFPPTFLLSGTRDLFLSNTVRQHRALRRAGVEAELHVFEAMWHGFSGVPEHLEAEKEMIAFFDRHLAQ